MKIDMAFTAGQTNAIRFNGIIALGPPEAHMVTNIFWSIRHNNANPASQTLVLQMVLSVRTPTQIRKRILPQNCPKLSNCTTRTTGKQQPTQRPGKLLYVQDMKYSGANADKRMMPNTRNMAINKTGLVHHPEQHFQPQPVIGQSTPGANTPSTHGCSTA
ncbi:MAG: hypothetical protein IPO07_26950 [Haliscomenobacter sp.]|nr:hypothetical protein [Haliscomenobacter sp.]MBK9492036.1 hypothetical protein [Haliscomenobacter sp.]